MVVANMVVAVLAICKAADTADIGKAAVVMVADAMVVVLTIGKAADTTDLGKAALGKQHMLPPPRPPPPAYPGGLPLPPPDPPNTSLRENKQVLKQS
jgi:hypothetical protein